MKLEKQLLNRDFSHIYVEKEAFNYEMTKNILEKFKDKEIVVIDNYKEIFSKNNQDFMLQKMSKKLILAVKYDKFLYEGAKVCESFGNDNFYYVSSVLNCIYDCEYCYLQGVYSSANIVFFVNIEKMFDEIQEELKRKNMYICISYDTDLLALDGVSNIVKKWYDFVNFNKNIKIELRTKSANIRIFKDLKPNENFIIAWTFSPDEIARKYEIGTPSLEQRIKAGKELIDQGWRVRVCFDPMLKVENFKGIYSEMIDKVFSEIPGDKLLDVSVGTFRISKEYLKRMRKNRGNSLILHYPFECINGIYSYSNNDIQNMFEIIVQKILKYITKNKIFV